MSSDSANTEAFFNLDIVDGDIVSINNNPRKSPVSYTDFPDIFKSPPSSTTKKIPPPPSQPPPPPPPPPTPPPSAASIVVEEDNDKAAAAAERAAYAILHTTPKVDDPIPWHEEQPEETNDTTVDNELLRTSFSREIKESSPITTNGTNDEESFASQYHPPLQEPNTTTTATTTHNGDGQHRPKQESCHPSATLSTSKYPSLSFREQVRGGHSKRSDFPLVPSKVALLIIDVQDFCCSSVAETTESSSSYSSSDHYYREEALPRMLDNISILLQSFRTLRDTPFRMSSSSSTTTTNNMTIMTSPSDDVELGEQGYQYREQGLEVIFTIIQSKTKDGRDLSLDYKLSGPEFSHVPTVDTPLEELFPTNKQVQPDIHSGKGDILVSKTSCSVFISTNLDYILRNLNVEQLVIVGQYTEQCIESAVRDAADLGYLVTVVEDACATQSLERHTRGLQGMQGFCRILSTAQVLDELHQSVAINVRREASFSVSSLSPSMTTTIMPTTTHDQQKTIPFNGSTLSSSYRSGHYHMTRKEYHPHSSPLPADTNDVFNMAFLRSLQHGAVSFLRYFSIDILHNLQCHVAPIEYLVQTGTLKYPVSSSTGHRHHHRRRGDGDISGKVHHGNDNNNIEQEEEQEGEDDAMLLIEPDLSTLQFLPHVPNTATMLGTLCTQDEKKEPSQYCARFRLSTIVQSAATYHGGIHFLAHAEIQFALHNATTGEPVDKYTCCTSSIHRLSSQGPFISDLDCRLRAQNIQVDSINAGNAPGQLSVALGRQSPLELADAVVLTQVTIRSVALEHSLKALFLPHMHSGGRFPGNGLSLFLSFDKMMEVGDHSSSSKLSATGASFVQGVLAHLSALVGITLTTKNSFRRALHGIAVGTQIGWGRKNKEATLLVGKTPYSQELQLEYRLCDNTCNLHLALAGILVCGIDGILRNLDLQPSLDVEEASGESLLPQSLTEAIDNLAKDTYLMQRIAPSVSGSFLAFRREEADRTATMALEDEIQEALENA